MVPRDTRFRFVSYSSKLIVFLNILPKCKDFSIQSMGGIYPSFYDVMRVNKLYNCDGSNPSISQLDNFSEWHNACWLAL